MNTEGGAGSQMPTLLLQTLRASTSLHRISPKFFAPSAGTALQNEQCLSGLGVNAGERWEVCGLNRKKNK